MKKENQPGNYQLKADLEGNYLIDKEHKATKRLGIFYAPSGGSVHKVARLIKQKLVDLQPDLFVISDVTPLRLLDYHNLILVCSTLGRNTWEMEQKDPWSSFLPKMLPSIPNWDRGFVLGISLFSPVRYTDAIKIHTTKECVLWVSQIP